MFLSIFPLAFISEEFVLVCVDTIACKKTVSRHQHERYIPQHFVYTNTCHLTGDAVTDAWAAQPYSLLL